MGRVKDFWGLRAVFFVMLGLVSTGSVLLFNIYLNSELNSWAGVITAGVASVFCTALVLMLCVRFKWGGVFVLPIVALSVSVHYYIKQVFGAYLSFQIVASMFETNSSEANTYCTWGNAGTVLAVLVASALVVVWGNRWAARWITWRAWAWVGGAFVLAAIPAGIVAKQRGFYRDDAMAYAFVWPLNDFRYNYKRIKEYLKKGMHQYAYIRDLPVGEIMGMPSPQEDVVIVFHIGESMRADHLPFNGYPRATMPLLAKRGEQIISYPHTFAHGTVTRAAVVGLLTDAEVRDRQAKHGSFVELFNSCGYRTSFICNRACVDVHSTNIFSLLSMVHDNFHIEKFNGEHRFDSTVLAFGRKIEGQGLGGKQLIVIYDDGCHFPFFAMQASRHFLPDKYDMDEPLANLESTINAYDNNIVEVDYEIDAIIRNLEDKVAVYIYVSDHGVALGEKGLFGSGNASDGACSPAFFMWISPRFEEKYPDLVRHLRGNKEKQISSDYLYHTILTLGGLKTSSHKQELDLTNPDVPEFILLPSRDILEQ